MQIFMFMGALVLQASIFASCAMFSSEKISQVACLFQTPLRLVHIIPSVSLLLLALEFFPHYNVLAILLD